jgi:hypothetical protein
MMLALLTLAIVGAPNESRLSASVGSPWGLLPSCSYLYRGPCGAPASLGVRYEHQALEGQLSGKPQALSLGVGLELEGLLGGGPGIALGGLPMGLARWGVWVTSWLELSVAVEVGAQVLPSAFQTVLFSWNGSLAARVQVSQSWFVSLEAGPFAGRLLAGLRW